MYFHPAVGKVPSAGCFRKAIDMSAFLDDGTPATHEEMGPALRYGNFMITHSAGWTMAGALDLPCTTDSRRVIGACASAQSE